MYWQKRFDKENPNKELEEKILEIRKNHKDFGYRRIYGELRKQGLVVNKKCVQRIMQLLGLQVASFTRKSRKYSHIRVGLERLLLTEFIDVLRPIFHIRRLQQIHLSLSIMK